MAQIVAAPFNICWKIGYKIDLAPKTIVFEDLKYFQIRQSPASLTILIPVISRKLRMKNIT